LHLCVFFPVDFNISLERTLLHFEIKGNGQNKQILINQRYHWGSCWNTAVHWEPYLLVSCSDFPGH